MRGNRRNNGIFAPYIAVSLPEGNPLPCT